MFDGTKLGFLFRQMRKSAAVRESLPEGDFREWKEIEDWSDEIARSLQETPQTAVKSIRVSPARLTTGQATVKAVT